MNMLYYGMRWHLLSPWITQTPLRKQGAYRLGRDARQNDHPSGPFLPLSLRAPPHQKQRGLCLGLCGSGSLATPQKGPASRLKPQLPARIFWCSGGSPGPESPTTPETSVSTRNSTMSPCKGKMYVLRSEQNVLPGCKPVLQHTGALPTMVHITKTKKGQRAPASRRKLARTLTDAERSVACLVLKGAPSPRLLQCLAQGDTAYVFMDRFADGSGWKFIGTKHANNSTIKIRTTKLNERISKRNARNCP